MCGIAGITAEDPIAIKRMTAALVHRGPDGNATEIVPGGSLGHARLAILDPRPEGDQPMWNEDRTIGIVFNGEIFNYRELREQEGFRCATTTDTEVILKLYERHGASCIEKLRGMFALGIYDGRDRSWLLARDPSGIKPLYVTKEDGRLLFASEVRSLIAGMKKKPSLDHIALSQYLRLQYVPGPRTLCEGIESLPPGTVMTWKNGRETRNIVIPVDQPTIRTPAEFREQFPAIMHEAVKRHLISDKPVGLFLSGGMDSSIVLHHMAGCTTGPVRTYTVRFEATEKEGAKRFNTDADLAALTAKHYGTDHHELLLTAEDYRKHYRETVRALDLPNADSVSVAQFLLARMAKENVDVILTGAGGDELFGGYPRYRIARVLHALRHVPPPLRSLGARLTGQPSDVLRMQPGSALAERLLARPPAEGRLITKSEWYDPAATTALFENRFNAISLRDPVKRFMEFDRHLWLVDESLRLADATTMGSGVEGRIPFLDTQVIASSVNIPGSTHVEYTRTKALIKDTYRHILPDHLYTLDKASFYPPLAKWLRRETAPLLQESLDHPLMNELFHLDRIKQLHTEHCNGAYHLHTLSTIMQLGVWLQEVYD